MGHHKHLIQGETYTAEIKVPEEGSSGEWTAKVRLWDDGERAKNVVLSGVSGGELAERLGEFATAFSAAQGKTNELAQPKSEFADPSQPSVQPQF